MPEDTLEPGVAGQGSRPIALRHSPGRRPSGSRDRVAEGFQNGFEPLIVEPDGRLQDLFFGLGRLISSASCDDQQREGLAARAFL